MRVIIVKQQSENIPIAPSSLHCSSKISSSMDATEFYKNVLVCITSLRLNRLIPYLANPPKGKSRIYLIKNLVLYLALIYEIQTSISVSYTTGLFPNTSLVITELFS